MSAALRAQSRHDRPRELDRADEVRLQLALDLLVGELLDRAALGIAGIRDDDVDAIEVRERLVDHPRIRSMSQTSSSRTQDLVAEALGEVIEPRRPRAVSPRRGRRARAAAA